MGGLDAAAASRTIERQEDSPSRMDERRRADPISGGLRLGRRGRAGRGLPKARARRGERRTRRRAAAPFDLAVPPHVARDIVGHSNIEVTMTIYAHVSLEEKRRALGKLGEALG